jgi:outer membrane protein assembly factor BamB
MSRQHRIAPLLFAAFTAACGPDSPTRPGGLSGDIGAPRVFWTQPAATSIGRPAFDSERVFFLGASHDVSAVAKGDGRILWRVTLPVSSGETEGSSVVFSGGLILVGDRDVFGLDPVSGTIRWRYTPVEGRRPGRWIMANRGDTLVTGSSSGHVYALDATTGQELWRTRLPEGLAGSGITTDVFDPVIDGAEVFVASTERPSVFPFLRGGVAALEMTTGRLIWARPVPQPYADEVRTGTFGVAVWGPVVAASSLSGHVYGFNRADGTLRWTLPPDSSAPVWDGRPSGDLRPLAADGARIIVGSGIGWVTAVDASTGWQLWRVNGGGGGTGGHMWADRGTAYTVHIGGQVTAYETATGAVRWQLNGTQTRTITGMVLDGSRWYAGALSGVFAAER